MLYADALRHRAGVTAVIKERESFHRVFVCKTPRTPLLRHFKKGG